MTNSEFMIRPGNHKLDFAKEKLRNRTMLSQHLRKLKNENVEYNSKWRILNNAATYNSCKRYLLCLLEKYYIISHPQKATLNQMCRLINSCVHSRPHILGNHLGIGQLKCSLNNNNVHCLPIAHEA